MKSQIIATALLFGFLSSFGQGNMQEMISRRDSLLNRGSNQKSGVIILISIGSASIIGGLIMLNQVDDIIVDAGKALGGFMLGFEGVGVLGIGIVQLIHGNHNIKKANRLTLEINKPVVINMGLNSRVLPYSVRIGIPIN